MKREASLALKERAYVIEAVSGHVSREKGKIHICNSEMSVSCSRENFPSKG